MKGLKHFYGINFLALALFLLFFFPSNIVYAGFGISPPWVENQHAVPGATFERVITITQEKAPRDLKVSVTINGADVSKWIVVKEGNEFIIPKDAKQYPIYFLVKIPEDVVFGFYEGTIDIVGTDPEKGDGQVAIALGAQARIKINVSDEEFSDFQVQKVSIPNIEYSWPLEVRVALENIGNRPVRPSRVTLRIWDNYHTQQLFSYDITDMTFVEPFIKGESVGAVEANLEIGQYWGEIEVYKEGELVLGDKMRVEVFPRWTLKKKPIITGILDTVFGTTAGVVVFSILATLIAASAVFFLIFRKIQKS